MTPLKLTLLKVWNHGIHKRKHQFMAYWPKTPNWMKREWGGLTIRQNWHVSIILRTGRSSQPVLTNGKRPKKIVFRHVIELRGWTCFHNVVKIVLSELMLTHDSRSERLQVWISAKLAISTRVQIKRSNLEVFSSNYKTYSAKTPNSMKNQRTRCEDGNSDNFS